MRVPRKNCGQTCGPDVLDVANARRVECRDSQSTNGDLARSVRNALHRAPRFSHDEVRCTVAEGVACLDGETDHWHRDDATCIALSVPGVRGVINQLKQRELRPEIYRAEDCERAWHE